MSRKGDCWVNAPTESLWGRLKAGRLYGRKFETRRQAMDEVIDWLTFYNHRRLHSALGYVSPMLFEKKLARGTSIEGRTMEWLKKVRLTGACSVAPLHDATYPINFNKSGL